MKDGVENMVAFDAMVERVAPSAGGKGLEVAVAAFEGGQKWTVDVRPASGSYIEALRLHAGDRVRVTGKMPVGGRVEARGIRRIMEARKA